MTEFEAGVRELVARLRDFDRRMKKVEDDAGALEQLVKLIRPGLGFDAPAGCNATLTGTVFGGGAANTKVFPGAQVDIAEQSTGTVLASAIANGSGIFSATFTLPAPVPIGGLTGEAVTLTVSAPASVGANYVRFQPTPTPYVVNAICGTSTPVGNLIATPATGYRYIFDCLVPVKESSIAQTDAFYGNRTLVYAASGGPAGQPGWTDGCSMHSYTKPGLGGSTYDTPFQWLVLTHWGIWFVPDPGTPLLPASGKTCADARTASRNATETVTGPSLDGTVVFHASLVILGGPYTNPGTTILLDEV